MLNEPATRLLANNMMTSVTAIAIISSSREKPAACVPLEFLSCMRSNLIGEPKHLLLPSAQIWAGRGCGPFGGNADRGVDPLLAAALRRHLHGQHLQSGTAAAG